jgi:hypothetical protein
MGNTICRSTNKGVSPSHCLPDPACAQLSLRDLPSSSSATVNRCRSYHTDMVQSISRRRSIRWIDEDHNPGNSTPVSAVFEFQSTLDHVALVKPRWRLTCTSHTSDNIVVPSNIEDEPRHAPSVSSPVLCVLSRSSASAEPASTRLFRETCIVLSDSFKKQTQEARCGSCMNDEVKWHVLLYGHSWSIPRGVQNRSSDIVIGEEKSPTPSMAENSPNVVSSFRVAGSFLDARHRS